LLITAASSIAEEAKDPSRVVPFSIFAASTVTYVVGFLFNIVLVFCMGDPSELVHSRAGQPVAQIFYETMGPGPAVFFVAIGFVVMNMVCIPSVQSGSRTLWSFSRDRMLPLSHIWYKINKRTDTPIIAVWLYAGLCVSINLIGLGSYVAIAAVFNVCAVALNISYVIPIVSKLWFGRFQKGPWNLGPLSPIINIWACLWNLFMGVIFLLPTQLPVTAANVRTPFPPNLQFSKR
jgi:amino acid transporter